MIRSPPSGGIMPRLASAGAQISAKLVFRVRSAQVRAYDNRAQCWKIGFPDGKSLRPSVQCPYLCSSDCGESVVRPISLRTLWDSEGLTQA